MRIGLMSLWNAANGPSIHAELVGRSWVEAGHKLTVFAPVSHPDARPTGQKDEPYVVRHYVVKSVEPFTRAASFDPSPLLEEDYEVFVAENVERLPLERLLELFPRIREKAATVMVVHEGNPPRDPLFYKLRWDAITCFDHRYKAFIQEHFPKNKIHIIPFPCHPMKLGDKSQARRRLNLPREKAIIFSYGFRVHDVLDAVPEIAPLAERRELMYLVAANPASPLDALREAERRYGFFKVWVKSLPLPELYTHLHASDIHLINRPSLKGRRAVLSSSIHLTLGSGCPILVRDSNLVELHGDEVVKYRDYEDMRRKAEWILEGGFSLENVVRYVEERRADRVAERFINLFRELLEKR